MCWFYLLELFRHLNFWAIFYSKDLAKLFFQILSSSVMKTFSPERQILSALD